VRLFHFLCCINFTKLPLELFVFCCWDFAALRRISLKRSSHLKLRQEVDAKCLIEIICSSCTEGCHFHFLRPSRQWEELALLTDWNKPVASSWLWFRKEAHTSIFGYCCHAAFFIGDARVDCFLATQIEIYPLLNEAQCWFKNCISFTGSCFYQFQWDDFWMGFFLLVQVLFWQFFLQKFKWCLENVITMGVTGLHNSYPRVLASLEFGLNEYIF